MYDLVVSKLRPKAKICDVYNSALEFVKQKKPELAPHFLKHVGFGTGIESFDNSLRINEKNQKIIKPGMSFVVYVGFENIKESNTRDDPKRAQYSLLISDTYIVTAVQTINLTKVKYLFEDVSYSLEEEEEEADIDYIPPSINEANIIGKRTRNKINEEKTSEEKRKEQQMVNAVWLKAKRTQQAFQCFFIIFFIFYLRSTQPTYDEPTN